MSRAEFIQHGGCRILRLDMSGLSTDEFLDEYRKAMRLLVAEPELSVRLLTIPPDHFDERVANDVRQWAPKKAKHVLAEAMLRASTLHKLLFLGNKAKYRLDREVFDDEQAAKDWLASR